MSDGTFGAAARTAQQYQFPPGAVKADSVRAAAAGGVQHGHTNVGFLLVERLPQLQVLEVGLCKHSDLLTAAGVGDRAEVTWEMLHPGFVDMQPLCSIARPMLQVNLGYARQWLE